MDEYFYSMLLACKTFLSENDVMQAVSLQFSNGLISTFDGLDLQCIANVLNKETPAVVRVLCIWNSLEPDVPSYAVRQFLSDINPANKNALILLKGADNYVVKELKIML